MKPKKRIMAYSERDRHGNGRGVTIELKPDAAPQDILDIDKEYTAIGWKPSPGTRKIVENARKVTK